MKYLIALTMLNLAIVSGAIGYVRGYSYCYVISDLNPLNKHIWNDVKKEKHK